METFTSKDGHKSPSLSPNIATHRSPEILHSGQDDQTQRYLQPQKNALRSQSIRVPSNLVQNHVSYKSPINVQTRHHHRSNHYQNHARSDGRKALHAITSKTISSSVIDDNSGPQSSSDMCDTFPSCPLSPTIATKYPQFSAAYKLASQSELVIDGNEGDGDVIDPPILSVSRLPTSTAESAARDHPSPLPMLRRKPIFPRTSLFNRPPPSLGSVKSQFNHHWKQQPNTANAANPPPSFEREATHHASYEEQYHTLSIHPPDDMKTLRFTTTSDAPIDQDLVHHDTMAAPGMPISTSQTPSTSKVHHPHRGVDPFEDDLAYVYQSKQHGSNTTERPPSTSRRPTKQKAKRDYTGSQRKAELKTKTTIPPEKRNQMVSVNSTPHIAHTLNAASDDDHDTGSCSLRPSHQQISSDSQSPKSDDVANIFSPITPSHRGIKRPQNSVTTQELFNPVSTRILQSNRQPVVSQSLTPHMDDDLPSSKVGDEISCGLESNSLHDHHDHRDDHHNQSLPTPPLLSHDPLPQYSDTTTEMKNAKLSSSNQIPSEGPLESSTHTHIAMHPHHPSSMDHLDLVPIQFSQGPSSSVDIPKITIEFTQPSQFTLSLDGDYQLHQVNSIDHPKDHDTPSSHTHQLPITISPFGTPSAKPTRGGGFIPHGDDDDQDDIENTKHPNLFSSPPIRTPPHKSKRSALFETPIKRARGSAYNNSHDSRPLVTLDEEPMLGGSIRRPDAGGDLSSGGRDTVKRRKRAKHLQQYATPYDIPFITTFSLFVQTHTTDRHHPTPLQHQTEHEHSCEQATGKLQPTGKLSMYFSTSGQCSDEKRGWVQQQIPSSPPLEHQSRHHYTLTHNIPLTIDLSFFYSFLSHSQRLHQHTLQTTRDRLYSPSHPLFQHPLLQLSLDYLPDFWSVEDTPILHPAFVAHQIIQQLVGTCRHLDISNSTTHPLIFSFEPFIIDAIMTAALKDISDYTRASSTQRGHQTPPVDHSTPAKVTTPDHHRDQNQHATYTTPSLSSGTALSSHTVENTNEGHHPMYFTISRGGNHPSYTQYVDDEFNPRDYHRLKCQTRIPRLTLVLGADPSIHDSDVVVEPSESESGAMTPTMTLNGNMQHPMSLFTLITSHFLEHTIPLLADGTNSFIVWVIYRQHNEMYHSHRYLFDASEALSTYGRGGSQDGGSDRNNNHGDAHDHSTIQSLSDKYFQTQFQRATPLTITLQRNALRTLRELGISPLLKLVLLTQRNYPLKCTVLQRIDQQPFKDQIHPCATVVVAAQSIYLPFMSSSSNPYSKTTARSASLSTSAALTSAFLLSDPVLIVLDLPFEVLSQITTPMATTSSTSQKTKKSDSEKTSIVMASVLDNIPIFTPFIIFPPFVISPHNYLTYQHRYEHSVFHQSSTDIAPFPSTLIDPIIHATATTTTRRNRSNQDGDSTTRSPLSLELGVAYHDHTRHWSCSIPGKYTSSFPQSQMNMNVINSQQYEYYQSRFPKLIGKLYETIVPHQHKEHDGGSANDFGVASEPFCNRQEDNTMTTAPMTSNDQRGRDISLKELFQSFLAEWEAITAMAIVDKDGDEPRSTPQAAPQACIKGKVWEWFSTTCCGKMDTKTSKSPQALYPLPSVQYGAVTALDFTAIPSNLHQYYHTPLAFPCPAPEPPQDEPPLDPHVDSTSHPHNNEQHTLADMIAMAQPPPARFPLNGWRDNDSLTHSLLLQFIAFYRCHLRTIHYYQLQMDYSTSDDDNTDSTDPRWTALIDILRTDDEYFCLDLLHVDEKQFLYEQVRSLDITVDIIDAYSAFLLAGVLPQEYSIYQLPYDVYNYNTMACYFFNLSLEEKYRLLQYIQQMILFRSHILLPDDSSYMGNIDAAPPASDHLLNHQHHLDDHNYDAHFSTHQYDLTHMNTSLLQLQESVVDHTDPHFSKAFPTSMMDMVVDSQTDQDHTRRHKPTLASSLFHVMSISSSYTDHTLLSQPISYVYALPNAMSSMLINAEFLLPSYTNHSALFVLGIEYCAYHNHLISLHSGYPTKGSRWSIDSTCHSIQTPLPLRAARHVPLDGSPQQSIQAKTQQVSNFMNPSRALYGYVTQFLSKCVIEIDSQSSIHLARGNSLESSMSALADSSPITTKHRIHKSIGQLYDYFLFQTAHHLTCIHQHYLNDQLLQLPTHVMLHDALCYSNSSFYRYWITSTLRNTRLPPALPQEDKHAWLSHHLLPSCPSVVGTTPPLVMKKPHPVMVQGILCGIDYLAEYITFHIGHIRGVLDTKNLVSGVKGTLDMGTQLPDQVDDGATTDRDDFQQTDDHTRAISQVITMQLHTHRITFKADAVKHSPRLREICSVFSTQLELPMDQRRLIRVILPLMPNGIVYTSANTTPQAMKAMVQPQPMRTHPNKPGISTSCLHLHQYTTMVNNGQLQDIIDFYPPFTDTSLAADASPTIAPSRLYLSLNCPSHKSISSDSERALMRKDDVNPPSLTLPLYLSFHYWNSTTEFTQSFLDSSSRSLDGQQLSMAKQWNIFPVLSRTQSFTVSYHQDNAGGVANAGISVSPSPAVSAAIGQGSPLSNCWQTYPSMAHMSTSWASLHEHRPFALTLASRDILRLRNGMRFENAKKTHIDLVYESYLHVIIPHLLSELQISSFMNLDAEDMDGQQLQSPPESTQDTLQTCHVSVNLSHTFDDVLYDHQRGVTQMDWYFAHQNTTDDITYDDIIQSLSPQYYLIE